MAGGARVRARIGACSRVREHTEVEGPEIRAEGHVAHLFGQRDVVLLRPWRREA